MKKQINGILKQGMWCGILLFALRCLISFGEIKNGITAYEIWSYAGEAIGAAAILMIAYEKWLWYYNPFAKTPKIRGSYSGTLTSTYDSLTRAASLKIKQSLLTVDVTLKTEESSSRSVSASIEEIFGEKELIYTYLNEPKSQVRDRSEIHYGTATFFLDEENHLVGRYYTDRNTSGDMDFKRTSNK